MHIRNIYITTDLLDTLLGADNFLNARGTLNDRFLVACMKYTRKIPV